MYEHDKPLNVGSDLGVLLDVALTEEDMKLIRREARKKKNIFKEILEAAEELREDRRRYYQNVFKRCISKEAYDEFISTKEKSEVNRFVKRIIGDALSFLFHLLMLPLEEKKDEIRRSIEMRNFKWSVRMIKRNLFYTWDAVSLMVNCASLKELFKAAREGDDESLFKLVKVDKTLFEHDWVRKRINRASYSGDCGFFESLGEAIKSDPLAHDSRNDRGDKLFIVLKYFWNFGLYRLTDIELHEMLIESEIADRLEIRGVCRRYSQDTGDKQDGRNDLHPECPFVC